MKALYLESTVSSFIAAIRFIPLAGEGQNQLHVHFRENGVVSPLVAVFEGVPENVAVEFAAAESLGGFFNRHIRNSYPVKKVLAV